MAIFVGNERVRYARETFDLDRDTRGTARSTVRPSRPCDGLRSGTLGGCGCEHHDPDVLSMREAEALASELVRAPAVIDTRPPWERGSD